MAYIPTNWANETPEETPLRFKITQQDGTILDPGATIELVTPVTPGTPVNATNMNKIETAIQNASQHVDNLWTQVNAGAPKIFQARGDLIAGDGVNVGRRVPLGANGRVLVANSLLAGGVEWQNVGVSNGNGHDHSGGDGAQINHANLAGIGSNSHALIDAHLAASAPHPGHIMQVARAQRNTAQSFVLNTMTIVDFSTKTFDPDNRITTGSAWKFTANRAGYYRVVASVIFSQYLWDRVDVASISLYKNNALYSLLHRDARGVTSTLAYNVHLHGEDIIYLNIGDFIDVRAWQNNSQTRALHNDGQMNFISITQIA